MNTIIESPNLLRHVLAQHIDEGERNRRISPEVFNALKEAGYYKLFLPQTLGGSEMDPLSVAKLVEEISFHNTAAGWSIMVANISAWWCSRLPEEGIGEVFGNKKDTFIAGAFHPPMKATPVDGGFLINGQSPLTSNVHEADWIFVTAFVTEKEEIKLNNGIPEIIGVLMNPKDCQVPDTWHTVGMKATDSNDVLARDVFVPDHLHFPLIPEFTPNSFYEGNLYRYSAIGAGVACLIAPVALAVARNAINELKTLAERKTAFGSSGSLRERGAIQRKVGIAEAMVKSGRSYLFQTVTESWKKQISGERLSLEDKADLLLAATHTNQSCVQAVDLMYSASGTTGIYTRNKLSHYFVDAQVIRQHGFANESRYETAAQVYLGLKPDLPVLAF